MHHAVVANLQRALFLGVRQKQVLGQAPVEEQADMADLHHLEAGEAADLDLGFLRGGDDAVFAVQIDEHVEPVADLARLAGGDVAPRQEYFAVRTTVQVETEVGVLDHLQRIETPDQCHVAYLDCQDRHSSRDRRASSDPSAGQSPPKQPFFRQTPWRVLAAAPSDGKSLIAKKTQRTAR
ncbi:hypothetical protein D9M71_572820 [compost metagenome]